MLIISLAKFVPNFMKSVYIHQRRSKNFRDLLFLDTMW